MKKARITVCKDYVTGVPDRMLFGSFVEHLGRCVYGGIYEPEHPTADEYGFRGDVAELIKESGVSSIRYPGGNFVSGYNWEDGVGDRSKRPKTADLAWLTTEPNLVGTDEFAAYCKRLGVEPIYAVNLGSRGMNEARALIEYCNMKTGTKYADMRAENGWFEPHGIKYWCLGNEMDGEWQIGHKTAQEYARVAHETAKAMRLVDPNIKLVACGSSGYGMPTFPEWENTVLSECYDTVDCISMHAYYSNADGDTDSFLASSTQTEQYIKDVISVCDFVKSKKRSGKTMGISFDEYNVWYHSNNVPYEHFSVAPPILEDVYSLEDAVCLGGILIVLLRHCDRVRVACLAQLVNVIGAILTENGGDAIRQSIFYPFSDFTKYGSRGQVMNTPILSDAYTCRRYGDVSLCDAVVTKGEDGSYTVLAVNRSQTEPLELSIALTSERCSTASHTALFGDDKRAVNTFADPYRVSPRPLPPPDITENTVNSILPPLSWNVIRIK